MVVTKSVVATLLLDVIHEIRSNITEPGSFFEFPDLTVILVVQYFLSSNYQSSHSLLRSPVPLRLEATSKVEIPSNKLVDSYDVQLHNNHIRLWSSETTKRSMRVKLRHVVHMGTASRREMR